MTNPTLLKAILSMDAYNRGYNAKIDLRLKDTNGVVIEDSDTIYEENNVTYYAQIGDAQVYNTSSISLDEGADEAAGFYGLAYQVKDENGNVIDTVISYRGTDQLPASMNPFNWASDDVVDIVDGWITGAGYSAGEGSQAEMAINFYKSVTEELDPAGTNVYLDADISLTGHSLGGGLAGYVAANDNNILSVWEHSRCAA